MDKSEAQIRFKKADRLFKLGRFEDTLDELEAIDRAFPNNHRVLNAQARTLGELRRFEQGLAVCDRLLAEFQYEKIRPLREHFVQKIGSMAATPAMQAATPEGTPPMSDQESFHEHSEDTGNPRFSIKPIRLLLLVAIVAGMATGYVPPWIGGVLIGGYFLAKFAISALLKRLFTAPFKMKGKALAGADCTLHGVEWTTRPTWDEDEAFGGDGPEQPLRYAWLDVTITPADNNSGFTHWEPGELMLAPADLKFKGLDSLDHCYEVLDVKLAGANGHEEDEIGKYEGAQRLKLLVGIPENVNKFRFVYYVEAFGHVNLDE